MIKFSILIQTKLLIQKFLMKMMKSSTNNLNINLFMNKHIFKLNNGQNKIPKVLELKKFKLFLIETLLRMIRII